MDINRIQGEGLNLGFLTDEAGHSSNVNTRAGRKDVSFIANNLAARV